ncbi:MAG: NAD(P)H-hydrate epimerase [Planctomycetota bacterium]|jgi:NAD(P)H-hydrate epimerase
MRDQPALSRDEVRELDRVAIEDYGINGLILMENAGRWCARAASRVLGKAEGRKVTVVCGRGNNGGDGFVVARHLTNWGAHVDVLLLAAAEDVLQGGGETAANLSIILNMGIPLHEADSAEEIAEAVGAASNSDLLVDGLLGTGARGEVREPFRSAIRAINESECPVLAIDVPSGLDCDTGKPLGEAVRADRTVTFVARKIGFTQPGAQEYTGRVEVAEISIPRAAIERVVDSRQ